jgi:hypothetical protein
MSLPTMRRADGEVLTVGSGAERPIRDVHQMTRQLGAGRPYRRLLARRPRTTPNYSASPGLQRGVRAERRLGAASSRGDRACGRAQITHHGRVGRYTRIGSTGCLKCAECGLAGVALVLTAAAFLRRVTFRSLCRMRCWPAWIGETTGRLEGSCRAPPACLHSGFSQLDRSRGSSGSGGPSALPADCPRRVCSDKARCGLR